MNRGPTFEKQPAIPTTMNETSTNTDHHHRKGTSQQRRRRQNSQQRGEIKRRPVTSYLRRQGSVAVGLGSSSADSSPPPQPLAVDHPTQNSDSYLKRPIRTSTRRKLLNSERDEEDKTIVGNTNSLEGLSNLARREIP